MFITDEIIVQWSYFLPSHFDRNGNVGTHQKFGRFTTGLQSSRQILQLCFLYNDDYIKVGFTLCDDFKTMVSISTGSVQI